MSDMSTEAIHLLLVEDSVDDQELILRALSGLDRPLATECVSCEQALRDSLVRFRPSAVLSDFSMPGFSGQRALEIVREMSPDTPFIFVSGTIGEELAIEAMQRGASDYVLKGNLKRLRPSLERALNSADERRTRRQMESALRESDERFRAIVETTGDWIWQTDATGVVTYCNDSIEKLLGYAAGHLVGQDAFRFLVAEDRADAEAARSGPASATSGWRDLVRRWRHADGTVRLLESTAKPMRDDDGALVGFRGIDRDVTLRVQQATRIEHLARMHAVLSAFGNAILRSKNIQSLLDMTCRLLVEQGDFTVALVSRLTGDRQLSMANHFGNPELLDRLARLDPVELDAPGSDQRPSVRAFKQARTIVISDYATGLVPDDWRKQATAFGNGAQVSLPIGQPPWGVLSVCTRNAQDFTGEEIALLERLTGEIDYAREFIAQSERLEYIAYHNPTTGLPSRTAFHRLIAPRLARSPQLVAMADVARFRYFNQSRGRAFGDQLLREVAKRLRSLLPEDALFAHPGDDAFVFAYDSDKTADGAIAEVGSLLTLCCEKAFPVEGEQVRIQMHGSILLAPLHGQTGEDIERGLVDVLAEAQMHDARVLPFTEEVRVRTTRRVELEHDLRAALEQDAFELFLQPKFSADAQRLVGIEALLRWRHPQRGLISPADFIPVLESTGMIVEVGAWVRREGLRITRRWRERGHAGLRLAVNVSAQELRQLDFIRECEELLGPHAGDHDLDIEITESILMDDIDESIKALQTLRDLGCRVSIDDFGTGYSSLNYLSRLPADTLKIDRSFVSLLAHSPDTVSLVTNIIGLAHSLGLRVVAEGVEEEEQAKLLRLLRCDELQGYLFGRPMPVADFERQYID